MDQLHSEVIDLLVVHQKMDLEEMAKSPAQMFHTNSTQKFLTYIETTLAEKR